MNQTPDKRFHSKNSASSGDWRTKIIGADKLRTVVAENNSPVVVAVLDTGVKLNHQALKIWRTAENYRIEIDNQERICHGGHGFNHRPDDGSEFNFPDDSNGHGTRVAGIIAAKGEEIEGVCPHASILPVKILDNANRLGCLGFVADGIKSAIYAKNELGVNVRVINISCGMSSGILTDELNKLKTAIADAEKAGILIVASTGNAGFNIGERKNRYYPACIEAENLIAVAATDADDQKMPRSNYLESAVGAPGDLIATLGLTDENSVLSDTSAAAALVSGAAALIFSLFPTASCAAVKSAFLDTGEDAGGHLKEFLPHGRLNVFAAYREIMKNAK